MLQRPSAPGSSLRFPLAIQVPLLSLANTVSTNSHPDLPSPEGQRLRCLNILFAFLLDGYNQSLSSSPDEINSESDLVVSSVSGPSCINFYATGPFMDTRGCRLALDQDIWCASSLG